MSKKANKKTGKKSSKSASGQAKKMQELLAELRDVYPESEFAVFSPVISTERDRYSIVLRIPAGEPDLAALRGGAAQVVAAAKGLGRLITLLEGVVHGLRAHGLRTAEPPTEHSADAVSAGNDS